MGMQEDDVAAKLPCFRRPPPPPPPPSCPTGVTLLLQLLVDHIRCQEGVERILQLQEQLLASLQAAPDPEAAIQAALGRSVADQLPGSNWSTSIAANVTVGHIMAVNGMTMQVCVCRQTG